MEAMESLLSCQQLASDTFYGSGAAGWTFQVAPELLCPQGTAAWQQWPMHQENSITHAMQTASQQQLLLQGQKQVLQQQQEQHQQQEQQQQQPANLMLQSDNSLSMVEFMPPCTSHKVLWHNRSAAMQCSKSLQQHVRAMCGSTSTPGPAAAAAAGTSGAAATPVNYEVAAGDCSMIVLPQMGTATIPAAAARTGAVASAADDVSMIAPLRSNADTRAMSTPQAASQLLGVLKGQWQQAVHEACVAAAAANAASDAANRAHAAAMTAKSLFTEAMVSASDVLRQRTSSNDTLPSVVQHIHNSSGSPSSSGHRQRSHSLPQITSPTSSLTVSLADSKAASIGIGTWQAGSSIAAGINAMSEAAAWVPAAAVSAGYNAAARLAGGDVSQLLISPFYNQAQQQQQQPELQTVEDAVHQAVQQAFYGEQHTAKLMSTLQLPANQADNRDPDATALGPCHATLSSSLPYFDPKAAAAATGRVLGGGGSAAAAYDTPVVASPMANTPQRSQIFPEADLTTDWPSAPVGLDLKVASPTAADTADSMLILSDAAKAAATAEALQQPCTSEQDLALGHRAVKRSAAAVAGQAVDDVLEALSTRQKIPKVVPGTAAAPVSACRPAAAPAAIADLALVEQFLASPCADDRCIAEELHVTVDWAAAAAAPAADKLGVQANMATLQADIFQGRGLQDHCDQFSGALCLPGLSVNADGFLKASDHCFGLKGSDNPAAAQAYSGNLLSVPALKGSLAAADTTGVYPCCNAVHGVGCVSRSLTLFSSDGASDVTTAGINSERSSSLQHWTSSSDLDSIEATATAMAAGLGQVYGCDGNHQPTTITSGHAAQTVRPCVTYTFGSAPAAVTVASDSCLPSAGAAAGGCEWIPLPPAATNNTAGIDISRTVTSGQAELTGAIKAATRQDQQHTNTPSSSAAAVCSAQQTKPAAPLTAARLQQVLRHYRSGSK